jgi:peptidoglycan/LPS O-acetylase OafA/YrhL
VAFLGVLSYAFYLVHFVVIFAIQVLLPHAGGLARGIVALLVSLALSWVIYRLVERPCARLRRRLTD